jgi:hypothetical protein
MGRSAAQLERDITRHRDELGRSLDALREGFRRMVNPAEQAKRHPLALGGVVIAGLVVLAFGVFATVALTRGMGRRRRWL